VVVESLNGAQLGVKSLRSKSRTLKLAPEVVSRGPNQAGLNTIQPGEKLYLQSTDINARLVLDPAAFEARRAEEEAFLRKRWIEEGLPGTVLFLHMSCEMEYMLDHEAQRWGRSLKPGDKVTLRTAKPIPAVVKSVRPWRERTQLRLVVAGADMADLS